MRKIYALKIMKNLRPTYLQLIVLILFASSLAFAQTTGISLIDEKNVRAEMGFLASDAMQGRGSGTGYERIAAEYIGSQFYQFGLDPAGEPGWDGKPSYVQTVEVKRPPRLDALKWDPTETSPFKLGKDWLALTISSADISGPLRKITLAGSVSPGEIVFVNLSDTDTQQSIQPKIAEFFKEGASAVLVRASSDMKERWSQLSDRKPAMSQRGNVLVLSDDAAGVVSNFADGTPIAVHAKFGEPERTHTWNAMGKITGSDPSLSSEIILLTSHLDHLGVRANAPGDDKIFNGADDDASGSVAVLEMARVLGSGKKPKRTVYFVCFGSEEAGGYGAGWFVNNMPFPKDKLVANLEFEMIGRPDDKVKPDELWLTGYERSNLGPELAKRGAKLVRDPHPDQNFFQRSDNIQLARAGIIAHTVSSYGLHTDYHKASDEIRTIDFVHMTRSINSMVEPVQWLINSDFKPAWNPGGKP